MATRDQTPARTQRAGIRGIETRSIDWIPDNERHGKVWHQAPLWFLGNFQYFTIPIGFIGPSFGLSLGWTIVAGTAGILVGTLFMALHATQGPTLGLPQMIQSRAQFGFRGVIVALFAMLFTYMAFNVADQVLLAQGLHGAFGWNANLVAIVVTAGAALLAIYGYDWVHRVFRGILFILLPLVAIITIGVLAGQAGGVVSHHVYGFNWTGFMAQLSAAAAYNITYAGYVSDYSRYLPRDTPRGKIIGYVFAGAATPAIWLIALGAWLAIRLGATDGLVGLQTAGNNVISHLGGITGFLSAVALAATMGMNAYGAMLTTLAGVDAFRKVNPTRNAPGDHHSGPDGDLVRGRQGDHHHRGRCRRHRADAHALPAGAVDSDQPDRLLLRAARPLRDHGHLPAQRDLRDVVISRPHRLRRRLRGRDPVHGAAQPGHLEELLHRAAS